MANFTQLNSHYALFDVLREKVKPIGDFMYGTTKRTWTTLTVTFAMLVIGISMMQYTASGKAACALASG
jgi:hypothetical protein